MTTKLSALRFLSFLLVLSAVHIRAADQPSYGTLAGTVDVPAGVSAAKVQRCLVLAAEARGWTVLERDDEQVLIQLLQRKWVARITIRFTTKEVLFFSNSTKGGKPKVPEDWIENLKGDVETNLRSPEEHQ